MKKKTDWIYLSYPLSEELSAYGNGKRLQVNQVRRIDKGDGSNNTEISLPTHFGTHIDFPYHFSCTGETIDDISPDFFVFKNTSIISIESFNYIEDYLIKPYHLVDLIDNCTDSTELLFIKTGFCNKRKSEDYWKSGFGIGLGVAALLKQRFPQLRMIGFDLISLNSYQQREIGRKAHKEFLVDHNILLLEDVNLSYVSNISNFNQVIVSPLYIKGADGAPVTILANISIND